MTIKAPAASVDWVTPKDLVMSLGLFDLDPASTCRQTHESEPWIHAQRQFCKCGDGLSQEWTGRVWLNPPYERPLTEQFVRKLADHGNGICLVMARTDSGWLQDLVFGRATAILFLRRRPHFYTPEGLRMKDRATTASILVAYGKENAEALADSRLEGKILRGKSV